MHDLESEPEHPSFTSARRGFARFSLSNSVGSMESSKNTWSRIEKGCRVAARGPRSKAH
jgi:hypothetical protein